MSDSSLSNPTGSNPQAACPTQEKKETLEDLMQELSNHIKNSDWLEHNTPEKFERENPEIAKAYKEVFEKINASPS